MTPLNLEQTLSYLRERMPAPFDLPQLAHLCRTGDLTPLFSYDRYALDYEEYFIENCGQELTFQLSGYLTAPALVQVIASDTPAIIKTATIYDYTNAHADSTRQAMKGAEVILLANDFNYSRYQREENYSVFSDNDGVTITRNDLLFDLEQLDSIAPAKNTAPTDDEPKHPKSVGSMTSLIATLIKMAEYDKADLEQPTGEINKTIVAKAQNLGLKVEKDFVAKWLKNAYEAL